ncbi:vacuolar protein sorting-associated protein 26C isoform X2 [Vanessa atalanta]|uniref:vacuolar protein sorting-associated protein 26C isoform X2 n=1 Tax=Vanessa atalanta TaxID=42275 RepID=UPI001FCE288C|nr:vacuolar protein sorting-associated protein 26C isoform X2 [Vanessa atalanta]
MTASLTISLKRVNKIYHEGEIIAGVVIVDTAADLRHEGLTLTMEGSVNLQISSKNAGIFDAFSNNIRPINLVNTSIELAAAGKMPIGVTEIPFEMPLVGRQSSMSLGLLETYHGVFVNVMYTLKCSMKRSFLNKPLNASCQFFVQYKQQERPPSKPVRCEVSPATLRAGGGAGAARGTVPHFQLYAEIDSTVCALDRPITGKIRVDECSVPIKSIELQLVRVETCGSAEGYSKDATEVQNIQVCEGDVRRARAVPLHLVLPRLFTCPTTATPYFKIEFELNIAVIFEDDYLVTENFPILLLRSK